MTECHPDVCPHMHFNKCYNERIRSIPNTIFPDPTIDSFTNVNVKVGNPYKSNIPTVAYENFNCFHEQSNDERNFVKDYYMENYEQSKMVLNNNIVNELKEDMVSRNAYNLAENATKDYQQFENKRRKALEMARQRARSAYSLHVLNRKEQRQAKYEQNGYWLKKLFRKLEQVARHIIQGAGEDAGEREKQFLLSKVGLTAGFLAQIKIRNPKNAFDILEELRILMMKKKLQFSDAREEQQLNQSVSMSYTSEASQNTSQGSMISEATSMNSSNFFGEDQVVNKFWDFDELKLRWHLEDIEDVKVMIRRMLTKQVVSGAELQAVKNRKQAQQMNEKILQAKGRASNSKAKSANKPKSAFKSKQQSSASKAKIPDAFPSSKSTLTKNQENTKRKIIQGGRFDAIGEKLQRNRAYSDLFKKKESEIQKVFVEKELRQNVFAGGQKTMQTLVNSKKLGASTAY